MTSFPEPGNEVIQDGGRKRKGRHLAPPPQWGSKRPPQVLVDVISDAWIKMPAPQVTSGGRWDSREDVLQTSVPSSERGRPSPKTSCRCLKLCFYFSEEIKKSIWSLASLNHSRNGSGSCPLAITGKSISLHVSTPRSMKRGVDFGKHLLYFFLTVPYNIRELL